LQQPLDGYTVLIEAKETTVQHSKPLLYLIVYDTQHVERLNAHWELKKFGLRPMYAPAKYAVAFHVGAIDSEILASSYLERDERMNEAIWFNCERDLGEAIRRLQQRFPRKPIPDTIDYTVDWPLHLEQLITLGGTIVTPVPPKVIAHFIKESE